MVVRLQIFMVVKIHIAVFWIMSPCNDMVGYQCFGEPCCPHFHIGILPYHYLVS